MTKETGGGLRYDDGKNRLDLIPPEWPWALGEILTAGAKKYADRNWEKGMSHSKMLGCALRHIYKFVAGERYDDKPDAQGRPGTGCHHLALAAWNLLAWMSYDIRGVGDYDVPDAPKSTNGMDTVLPTQVEPIQLPPERPARNITQGVQLNA